MNILSKRTYIQYKVHVPKSVIDEVEKDFDNELPWWAIQEKTTEKLEVAREWLTDAKDSFSNHIYAIDNWIRTAINKNDIPFNFTYFNPKPKTLEEFIERLTRRKAAYHILIDSIYIAERAVSELIEVAEWEQSIDE